VCVINKIREAVQYCIMPSNTLQPLLIHDTVPALSTLYYCFYKTVTTNSIQILKPKNKIKMQLP